LIWGVGDPHILPRILQRAEKKRLMQIGEGKNMVDLTNVKNAAEAHINAAEAVMSNPDISGKNYFISDDSPVNLWNWINDFLEKMGLDRITKAISFKRAYRIGSIMEFFFRALPFNGEPPMTRFVAIQMAHSHFFDISAAKKDLNYKPSVDCKTELETTIEWLKFQNK
jgi:nucleoside-diphosphate-sugar epimerase